MWFAYGAYSSVGILVYKMRVLGEKEDGWVKQRAVEDVLE